VQVNVTLSYTRWYYSALPGILLQYQGQLVTRKQKQVSLLNAGISSVWWQHACAIPCW